MDGRAFIEKLYNDTYALLYRVGLTFLVSTPGGADKVEDEIHNLFLLAYEKREKLIHHPCPEGWLVEAFRKRLLAYYRKWRREQGKIAFSLDGEKVPQMSGEGESQVLGPILAGERRKALDALVGETDASLFLLYCVERVPAKELSQRFPMTEACIRMRISRIRKKILQHPEMFLAAVFFFLLHS